LPQMVAGLAALDYPEDRKDVQLLLEADDFATRAAAAAMTLPPGFRVTVVPESFPRTKPKACNFGLALAAGEFLVIYDAEDKPEPDQLKKAVLAFEHSGPNVACVQSRLNFYNPTRNLLTRWFTADYSAWFDLQLPGLAALRTVIPLGGTSNHFRAQILRDLLGWDAYNVTEDCDLGVRLARRGYTTKMLETTTWEEACCHLPFWIKQRTRWQKGYIQTWFVHMRNPLALWRDLGALHFLHFQLLVGGGFFSALINPVFWALAVAWFFVQPAGISALFPGAVFAAGIFCLFVGNFCFVYVNLAACFKRGYDNLLLASLITPAYWALMSVSGWRALWQFFKNPFYWEKTQHGLK
ncbi:MAG: glycosyltransferase, partial [Kiritimatiellaeota bacterium]|nr:glycosyltransferase [Kiritimatiellota bacterium]